LRRGVVSPLIRCAFVILWSCLQKDYVKRMVSEGSKRGTLHKGATKQTLRQEVIQRELQMCLDILGGAKECPELCVTIMAHKLYREKFLFADL